MQRHASFGPSVWERDVLLRDLASDILIIDVYGVRRRPSSNCELAPQIYFSPLIYVYIFLIEIPTAVGTHIWIYCIHCILYYTVGVD